MALMRSIKDFGLSESRRAVRDGRKISPTGLGVPLAKRESSLFGVFAAGDKPPVGSKGRQIPLSIIKVHV